MKEHIYPYKLNCLTLKSNLMEFIEFKANINGKERITYINPMYIESIIQLGDASKTYISMASHNPIEANHTFEEVKKKLGIR